MTHDVHSGVIVVGPGIDRTAVACDVELGGVPCRTVAGTSGSITSSR